MLFFHYYQIKFFPLSFLRSISNDTSVQSLFMGITAMHSKLLRYIQEQDDNRIHFEQLQDKLTQVKDARAALDSLREEHVEKLRREAEEADRLRQLQMMNKLEIMRKKKQEFLQVIIKIILKIRFKLKICSGDV